MIRHPPNNLPNLPNNSINISSDFNCDKNVEQNSMIYEEVNAEKNLFSANNTYSDRFSFMQNN